MSVIPEGREAMIQFYKDHQELWGAAGPAIGLTLLETDDLKAKVEAAMGQQTAVGLIRQKAKSETSELNALADVLRATGALLMTRIRTFAESTGNANVYTLAEIPPPKPATPAGPPETPIEFTADPLANGTIELTWKGSIAQGQDFPIDRRIDGGAWVRRETVRGKKWTDKFVPMNTNVIQYRIFGRRNDVLSNPPAEANVSFGNLPAEILAAFRTGGADGGLAEAA